MNCKHFRDSPDIVKQRLLQWLSPCGKWSVHPMFTEPEPTGSPRCWRFSGRCADEGECADETFRMNFSPFIGSQPVTMATFAEAGQNRDNWIVEVSTRCKEHLFIDPDTGFWLQGNLGDRDHRKYLMRDELVTIAQARPNALTLVYDQSISRNDPIGQIRAKLRSLKQDDIHGFTYQSQATFVLVSKNPTLLSSAKGILLDSSELPEDRLIEI